MVGQEKRDIVMEKYQIADHQLFHVNITIRPQRTPGNYINTNLESTGPSFASIYLTSSFLFLNQTKHILDER